MRASQQDNRFRQAVVNTPSLGEDAYQPGLQALSSHSQRIRRRSNLINLLGSVDLDVALQNQYPNDPRWDYGIGVQKGNETRAIWIEVHPAHTTNVDEVLRKLGWLKQWLKTEAPDLNALTPVHNAFHWIATSGVQIAFPTGDSRIAKRLAQAGLRMPRPVLELDTVI